MCTKKDVEMIISVCRETQGLNCSGLEKADWSNKSWNDKYYNWVPFWRNNTEALQKGLNLIVEA